MAKNTTIPEFMRDSFRISFSDLFTLKKVYDIDFKQPEPLEYGVETYIGEKHYKDPYDEQKETIVIIFATSFPAVFWKFEIQNIDGRNYTIKTGTGSLQNFVPIIEAARQGMFSMEEITKEGIKNV